MAYYKAHETATIDPSSEIGEGTKIWHYSHVMSGAVIGSECVIGQNVYVASRARIGNGVKIQNNVSLYDGVSLEPYVFCGPSVVFTNDINPRSQYPKHGKYKETIVKRGATIGANATIICGITIGSYAMIGAGSVVTKNVPAYALVYGNPAQQHGWISEHGERLHFENGIGVCPVSRKKYKLENQIVRPA